MSDDRQPVPKSVAEKYGLVTQDSALRFVILSDERVDVAHMVDLSPWELDERFNRMVRRWERCTCENFEMRIQPLLRSGTIKPDTAAARCKHINRARELLATKVRDMIASRELRTRK